VSGHHDIERLRTEVEAAVAANDHTDFSDSPHLAAVDLLNGIRKALLDYCPNVQLVSDDQVEALARAWYTKHVGFRKLYERDIVMVGWDEEADNLKESWRDAIRFILATGELPREGIA
jgi:hypothetical protein